MNFNLNISGRFPTSGVGLPVGYPENYLDGHKRQEEPHADHDDGRHFVHGLSTGYLFAGLLPTLVEGFLGDHTDGEGDAEWDDG